MATKEERIAILRMIEEGKISAEEGARLISALGGAKSSERPSSSSFDTSRQLQIRVTDLSTNRSRVNVTLPIGLVRWALRWIPEEANVDIAELQAAIDAGVRGRIVEVTDQDENVRVEISLV